MRISNFVTTLMLFISSAVISPVLWADAMQAGLTAWAAGDTARAVAVWYPLAEQGDVNAQLYLAYAYRQGRGVAQDDERAAHWYRQAAQQGLADAQYQLGLQFELGLGLPQDQAEADYWYSKAVHQGYCPGELSAGGILSAGD